MTANRLVTEILFFRCEDTELKFRVEQHPLPPDMEPHQHVRNLVGLDNLPLGKTPSPPVDIIHSSGWRFDPKNDAVILTWSLFPDTHPQHGSRLVGAPNTNLLNDWPELSRETLPLETVATYAAHRLAWELHSVTATHQAESAPVVSALKPFTPLTPPPHLVLLPV